MTDQARRLKANKVLEGTPCGWCTQSIALGDDAVTCLSCGLHHHAKCWDGKRGCSRKGCAGAPLRELRPPALPPPPPPGRAGGPGSFCPQCRSPLLPGFLACQSCRAPVGPAFPSGPKRTAEGAVAALVYGILSFLICGFIFGMLAYQKGKAASEACDADPSLTGKGMAKTGMVLGIIGAILWAIMLFSRAANR